MNQVNERSTAFVTIGFRNVDGQLQEPLSVTYRIDDVESGQQIRPWTAITPGATVAIPLRPDDNVVLGEADVDTRALTFVATYGATPDDQVTGEVRWAVKNLRFLN